MASTGVGRDRGREGAGVRIVVADASALVELLLGTATGRRIASLVRGEDADLHTPELCDLEVVGALRRLRLDGGIGDERLHEAVRDYVDLPLVRHRHLPLLGRILALRENFSPYDASYVALAEGLDGELLTTDRRLRRAVENATTVALISPEG